ncbi:MAG: hypothetical protein K8S18_02610, partial [Desulfobacula sp.]|nr:hypothetical protein [Desulfobacula sp.]
DIPVDLGIELEFRCDKSSLFFVNIMKNKISFELDGFRPILWEQIKNALESCFKQYQFEDLNTGLQFKKELASHLESHLRITFERKGLDFVQVKAISFSQEILDKLKQKATQRKFKRQEIKGDREDVDIKAEQMDVDIEKTGKLGNKEIDHNLVKVQLLQKRVDVLKGIQKADVEKIKTKEDFRKFQQEVDREKVLDETEWKEFEREILWKDEDQQRDRSFFVKKVELQQDHDIKRLTLLNNKNLTIDEKKTKYEILDLELIKELELELKKIEGLAKVQVAQAEVEIQTKKIKQIGDKETQLQVQLKNLEMEKNDVAQDIELAVDKGKAQLKLKTLDLEYDKLEFDFAMAVREKKDAQDLKKQAELDVLDAKRKNSDLELKLSEAAAKHNQELEIKSEDARIERERMEVLAGLNIEQLISISGQSQSAFLADLAQSQTLKGLGADEIMAMKNPAAFKEALVERAKNSNNDEMKVFYERIINLTEASSEKVANAHKESADRAERMARSQQETAKEAFMALSGQNRKIDEVRQSGSDKKDQIYEHSMDRVADVATARASSGAGAGGDSSKIMVCKNCKQEIDADANNCNNCGEKVY